MTMNKIQRFRLNEKIKCAKHYAQINTPFTLYEFLKYISSDNNFFESYALNLLRMINHKLVSCSVLYSILKELFIDLKFPEKNHKIDIEMIKPVVYMSDTKQILYLNEKTDIISILTWNHVLYFLCLNSEFNHVIEDQTIDCRSI